MSAVPTVKTRRLVMVGGLALAAALMAIAVIVYLGNPRTTDLPVAIQSVEPEPGTNVLLQNAVVLDLAVGYTAELDINGVVIPASEISEAAALNQLRFQPAEGKVLERLFTDQNCARATYWLIAQGPGSSQTFTWCFFAS